MNKYLKPAIAMFGLGHVLFGCASPTSQPATSTVDSSAMASSLQDDCTKYWEAFAANNEYRTLVNEYTSKFPFLNEYEFKEKLYVWDYSTGTADEYDSTIHEAEESYLMGEGPIPESLKGQITTIEPFTDAEKEWIAERSLWENKLNAARLTTTNTDEIAANLWPKIENKDLKDVLKQISNLSSTEESGIARTNAFISADSICEINQ